MSRLLERPLKRKSEKTEFEAESSECNPSTGNAETFGSPFQTPVSGKGGKTQKAPRSAKCNRSGSQTPAAVGSPSGNNLTPVGPCRYDSSLGCGSAFITGPWPGEAEVENLSIEEHRLDDKIREMQEKLRELSENENNQKWLFVTEDDIKSLPCFQNETLIAIKAPHGTTLEVPDPDEAVDYPQRRYRIVLRSTMGPVDVYLVSQFEEKFEESNAVEAPPGIPSTLGFNENPAVPMAIEETTINEIEMQGQEDQRLCTDTNASQDFVSGIMKIVPEVDSDADYWLLSDADVSITDLWRTEPGVEWLHDDYAIANVSTPRPQTPPSSLVSVGAIRSKHLCNTHSSPQVGDKPPRTAPSMLLEAVHAWSGAEIEEVAAYCTVYY
ncbi:E2F transcription factor 1 [Actinidia rufa]|uniref:E2F transcription factor 1 n=1 Tax=Actinidia rufa TaxID=165716 RepID=A0A7J0HB42_9ERIC|nr:E2F transcription factor 1 [Actinidia rufa]